MKPDLLYLSPVAPSPDGHGLGMRALAVLRTLTKKYSVHLLALDAPPANPGTREALEGLCARCAFFPIHLWRRGDVEMRTLAACWPRAFRSLFPRPYEWSRIARAKIPFPFDVREFEVAHVFRGYMLPMLDRMSREASWNTAQLDLDELESRTRLRLADLQALRGNAAERNRFALEARQYEALERSRLPGFDRLFIASPTERDHLLSAGLHASPEVLPNIAGPARLEPRRSKGTCRLLFVGALGYLPNADAIRFFCREILPLVKAGTSLPVSFDIVGAGLPKNLTAEIAQTQGVVMHGRVADLAPCYARADVVVVPLRAGGGTRIKILEAFSFGRPVVSTEAGIEGIAAVDGIHAMVARDAESFAKACVCLAAKPDLAARMADNAAGLVRERYSQEYIDTLL